MKKFLALTLCITMICTGCSVAWLSTFEGYLKVAGPILIQILDIVALAKGQPVNAHLQAKITADSTALNALAQSVSTATQQNVQGTCAEFNLAVQTLAGDLSEIEQLANVGPTTSNEISAALGIAQSAISEVEAPIAACQTAPSANAALTRLQAHVIATRSPEDVVRRFNAVVDKKHRVHLHGAFVRFVTFGRLQ